MDSVDVLIVGAGPAGVSTALHLLKIDPAYGPRVVVIERAASPRNKVCGGGVTGAGLDLLRHLRVALPTQTQPIRTVRFRRGQRILDFPERTGTVVVSRRDLDRCLLEGARAASITVREGEAYQGCRRDGDRILVTSDKTRYACRVLVGADGSASRVAVLFGARRMMGGLRVELPLSEESAEAQWEFQNAAMTFDFTPLSKGWYGYLWRFPSVGLGRKLLNLGFFYNRRRNTYGGLSPRQYLRDFVDDQGFPGLGRIQAAAIRPFRFRQAFSAPGILLAGDAIGTDPLLGEGISEAILGGKLAAEEIHEGLSRNDVSFTGYRHRVMASRLGSWFRSTWVLARLFYSPMNSFWLRMVFESPSVRRYVQERFSGYPDFGRDKRALLGLLLRYTLYRG
ncbi:MAG: FAD-dependent monooxygenase [Acidobacteriota bacterium]